MAAGDVDAVVVGAGPNGLAAAVALAREGRRVLVREAATVIGGGTRSAELTLPGFVHDRCSAVHPLGVSSPFFRTLPLEEHGLRWLEPVIPLAHPLLDGGPPALLCHSVRDTGASLEGRDGERYRALVEPFVERWDDLLEEALGPPRLPRRPVLLAGFGLVALRSMVGLGRDAFAGERARALLAGISAHATVPLTSAASFSFGLVLALAAHARGWPVAEGGSQRIADALASYLRSLGGGIETGAPVRTLADLPPAPVVMLDVTPRQALDIVGDRFPARYRRQLERFRYGPGSFKLDYALAGPMPWRDAACARAGTVHLGGTMAEMAAAEEEVWRGGHPERPYVLVAQQSVVDPTRAPAGRHTLWAYCHVPNGSTVDMTERVERQIDRFAPGWRDLILARVVSDPAALEAYDANYVGGDIAGGANVLTQIFTRPVIRWNPYRTPVPGLYFCSSSTPPGGGVHGLCGWHAARAALRA
ncbi:MAG TPA: NAD(P)/FAD-dependent oxidoreductase, partial [Gemmatimonadales bacterium]